MFLYIKNIFPGVLVKELPSEARFIRRISVVSNAIETIDNEIICFIIYCLHCIRHGRNATYERGLIHFNVVVGERAVNGY